MLLGEVQANSQDSQSELVQCKEAEESKQAAVIFESIQVMDGDLTDYIPDLLLAEEADEVDALEMNKTYGIESIFKIRCEIIELNQPT